MKGKPRGQSDFAATVPGISVAKLEINDMTVGIDDIAPPKPISFRNKSKMYLLGNSKALLEQQQVDQSLTQVPIEYVVLRKFRLDSDPNMPMTETFFSMPLH